MGGHCRCSFGCGAIDRTRAGCSCTGGKSHRCRGGCDPEDLEKQREKEREREKEKGTGKAHEERKEKEKRERKRESDSECHCECYNIVTFCSSFICSVFVFLQCWAWLLAMFPLAFAWNALCLSVRVPHEVAWPCMLPSPHHLFRRWLFQLPRMPFSHM